MVHLHELRNGIDVQDGLGEGQSPNLLPAQMKP